MRILLCLLLCSLAFGAVHPIPRKVPSQYFKKGVFEGGQPIRVDLLAVRLGKHNNFERWVIDFSGNSQTQPTLPKFQVRYFPEQSNQIVINLQNIRRNNLSNAKLRKLATNSALVKRVEVLPPVENGDRALRLYLKQSIRFAPHQPPSGRARLVLDITRSTNTK